MQAPYLRIILDVLFPPSDHERLLRSVTPERFVTQYHLCVSRNTIALAVYSSRTIQAAVAACKFEKNLHAAQLLASLLTHFLSTHTVQGQTILIPIPLSDGREQERGFNQVTRVLESGVSRPHHSIKKNWLIRPVDTTRQTSLGRQARLKNMKGAFATTSYVTQSDWSTINRIIICDDVMTTGATLEAARTTLQKVIPNHVKIICLAWAH